MISSFVYRAKVGATASRMISGGNVRFDDGSAPYIRSSIEVPVSAALLDATDPRQSPAPRCVIDVTTPQGDNLATWALNLTLRGRSVSHRGAAMTLDLASDEALLEDYKPLVDDVSPARYARLRDVVKYVLNVAIPGSGARLLAGVDAPAVAADADAEALFWMAGDSAIQFLAPIVQAAGLRLVCDERRNWTLRPDSYALEGGVPIVQVSGNLIDGDDRINRDDDLWFDAAVCRYRWIDSTGAEVEAIDKYALHTPYTRVKTYEKRARFPGSGFAEYAVRRAQARGREVSATTVAQWHVRPELFARIALPDTPLQMGNVRSADFSFNTDEITITARTIDTPLSAYILAPPGFRYIDFPPTMQIQNIDWNAV